MTMSTCSDDQASDHEMFNNFHSVLDHDVPLRALGDDSK